MTHSLVKARNNDAVILAILAIGTILLRLFTLMEINVGGDNLDYWYYGKSLLKGYPYDLYFHRAVRWGIIIPTAFIQLIFGTHGWVIYLPPILMTVLLNYTVFWLGIRFFDRSSAFLAIIIIQFFPYMIRMGSQLFLGVFSMNYILLSLLFLMQYIMPLNDRERKHSKVWFTLSFFFMFLSYLTKITNLYFFVPWLILLVRYKGWKSAISYGFLLFGLYLIEHLAYFLILNEPLGRLGIIMNTHLNNNSTMERVRGPKDGTILGLFWRYHPEHFPFYWHIVLWGGLFSSAILWLKDRKNRFSVNVMFLIIISFMLIITFGVTSLKTMSPFENFISRYFSAVLPFLALCIGRFIVLLTMKKIKRVPVYIRSSWPVWLFSAPLLGVFIMASLLPWLPSSASQYLNNPFKPKEHILVKVIHWEKQINLAAEQNILFRCWIQGPVDISEKRNSKKSLDMINRLYLNLDRNIGKFPEEFYSLPNGTQYKWINYGGGTPDMNRGIITSFREPFELIEGKAFD